jgi:hypothetical protein
MELRHSEQVGKLAEALAKAQLEFKPVKKETENPFYKRKYAELSTLIDATRPALAANGLVVIQTPRVVGNKAVEVSTMLLHSSGEFLAHDVVLPAWQTVEDKRTGDMKDRFDAQTIGSAITYGRRYSYQSVLCIAAEDDDDGNSLVKPPQQLACDGNGRDAEPSSSQHFEPSSNGRIINATQARAFWSAVKQGGKTEKQVLDYFTSIGIVRTEGMRKTDFDKAMKWALGSGTEAVQ